MIGKEAEQGRHEAGSHISGSHLDANQGLGPVRAEMIRGGMNNAGIHRCAAQADHHLGVPPDLVRDHAGPARWEWGGG